MRKVNKYIFLIVCLFVNFAVMADVSPGVPGNDVPPPHDCCNELAPADGQDDPLDPVVIAYKKCLADEAADPGSRCNPILPIDNSIYIYMSMVLAVGLASFVIIRKITHKKTPM